MAGPKLEGYDNILRQCSILQFHFWWGCAVILVGAFALSARIPHTWVQKNLRPWHATLGQMWMYGTVIQMATSLYCRSDGFRSFIFGFLVILVVNMIIGHSSIRAFQRRSMLLKPAKEGLNVAEVEMTGGEARSFGGGGAVAETDGRLAFYKTVHGISMVLSYSMLFGAGVAFSTRLKSTDGCLDLYAPHKGQATSNGSVLFEFAGNLYIGGRNFIRPDLPEL